MATPRKLAAIILAAATTVLANPVDVDLDKRAPTPVRAAALLRHTTYTYGNGYANVRTGLAIWVIIVIVIGVISSLCLCCLCCYCLRRHMGRDDKGPSTIPHYPPEPIMPQNYTTAPYDQGGMGYAGAGAPPVPPQYGSYPPEPYGQPPPPPGGGIGMRDMSKSPDPAAEPLDPEGHLSAPYSGHQRTASDTSLNTINQPPVQPAHNHW